MTLRDPNALLDFLDRTLKSTDYREMAGLPNAPRTAGQRIIASARAARDAMRWRYQPVWRDRPVGRRGITEREFTLCEICCDTDGSLSAWTENPAMSPMGGTVEELAADLSRMLADARKWEPVAYDALEGGMTFKRAGGVE